MQVAKEQEEMAKERKELANFSLEDATVEAREAVHREIELQVGKRAGSA